MLLLTVTDKCLVPGKVLNREVGMNRSGNTGFTRLL